MRAKIMFMALGMVAVLALAPAASAADLVVVATPATFAKNVAPSDLAGFKNAPYVVLLGALDEVGGIKLLVEKALIKAEFDQMNKPGSSAMFVKSNVWGTSQEVLIITGAGEKGVEGARKSNRAEWMDTIFGWFGVENETTGKSGTPSY